MQAHPSSAKVAVTTSSALHGSRRLIDWLLMGPVGVTLPQLCFLQWDWRGLAAWLAAPPGAGGRWPPPGGACCCCPARLLLLSLPAIESYGVSRVLTGNFFDMLHMLRAQLLALRKRVQFREFLRGNSSRAALGKGAMAEGHAPGRAQLCRNVRTLFCCFPEVGGASALTMKQGMDSAFLWRVLIRRRAVEA